MDETTKYTWLIAALISFVAWLVVFFTLKGSKKKFLMISLLMAVSAIFLNLTAWTVDWWRPTTITETRVGFEDILFGCAVGGIGASFYEWFFKLKSLAKKQSAEVSKLLILVLLPVVVAACFAHLFSFNSFYGWLVAVIPPTIWVLYKRPDLIKLALFTAISFVVAAVVGFWILNQYDPGFVDATWQLDNLTGWLVLGIPFEDLVWFMTIGGYLSIIHPYLKNYSFE